MLETLAPVTQIAGKVYVILERDFQFLLDNPGQYFVVTFTPAATFLSSAADSTKITLITSYSNLMDILAFVKDQPSMAFKSFYHHILSMLLDGYSDAISSMLVLG